MTETFIATTTETVFQSHPMYEADKDPSGEGYEIEVTKTYAERIFVDRDYFVQTITDHDETVLAFSVTSRSTRFKPRLQLVNFTRNIRQSFADKTLYRKNRLIDVRLQKSRLAELQDDEDDGPQVHVSGGARSPRLDRRVG